MTFPAYDAILVLSFGGPEKKDDVIPFLENVLRGKNVPRQRLLEVAEHYNHFDGVSPINQQCRDLIRALRAELDDHQINLRIYWGNRNWHPMLADTLRDMKADGVRRVLTFVTSGFSSYSGCRQYREDILRAQSEIGDSQISFDKIRVFYNHPDFISVVAQNVQEAIDRLSTPDLHVAFTAHSIPATMSRTSDYEQQLTESCRLVAETLKLQETQWELVYQSRSGRPQDPWLEPDICDHLKALRAAGTTAVVISPIGFLSDHMEVMYDLDDEAAKLGIDLGISIQRAHTPGTHPTFISMIRKLIQERLHNQKPQCVGKFGPNHDVCPVDCCPAPPRRSPSSSGRP